MIKNYIAVSYLGTSNEEQILIDKSLNEYKNIWAHVDIMDGIFVPNKSFETKEKYESLISNLKHNKVNDVHIMVSDIKGYIDMLVSSIYKPDYITFHLEACKDYDEVIYYSKYLKSFNIKCGVSIKPNTNIEEYFKFIEHIDLILLMSVEPGKGGQSFIEESTKKLEILDKYRNDHKLNIVIEVDGGINDTNINKQSNYCDAIVVGSYLTKHIDELKERASKLEHEIHI